MIVVEFEQFLDPLRDHFDRDNHVQRTVDRYTRADPSQGPFDSRFDRGELPP